MNYKKWLIEDLQNLDRQRFAITHLKEELEQLNAELTAIKATNFDKMPSGSGDNIQEEKLLTAIAKKDELAANLKATTLHVRNMESLLEKLPDDERRIIDCMIVNGGKYAADSLADELGYERRQIYNKRNAALSHLAQLRHGASYQP